MSSPTQRTLGRLRSTGYSAGVVEKWNPYVGPLKPDGKPCGIRQDLFGCIDIIAVTGNERGVTAVQACSYSDIHKRLVKAMLRPEMKVWLRAGNRYQVWGWKRGAATGRWQEVVRGLTLEDLEAFEKLNPEFFAHDVPERDMEFFPAVDQGRPDSAS